MLSCLLLLVKGGIGGSVLLLDYENSLTMEFFRQVYFMSLSVALGV
jgi:hypothetical protein